MEVWMIAIDMELKRLCGMGVDDLPDYNYADAFKAGRSPKAVAKAVIKAAKDF